MSTTDLTALITAVTALLGAVGTIVGLLVHKNAANARLSDLESRQHTHPVFGADEPQS